MTPPSRFQSSFAAALHFAASLVLPGAVIGAEPYEAFLEKHCIRCHGPEKEKGDLRLDRLSRDFKLGADSHPGKSIKKLSMTYSASATTPQSRGS